MSQDVRQVLAVAAVVAIAVILVYCVIEYLPEFGSFPERRLGGFENESIGQHILEKAPLGVYEEGGTGAANVVTSVIWDYRGYDTVGEATVLFTAVAGIAALFRITRREEE